MLVTNLYREMGQSTYKKGNGKQDTTDYDFSHFLLYRFANMDYAYTSLLCHHDPGLTKITSYDIVCQWSKNLFSRVKVLPSLVRTNLAEQATRFVIPKLHIHGHQLSCQLEYSLNWLPGAARTDGEGIERPWAHMGPIATSTRDMGPGSRHGTINDHFGHWNWTKLTRLGEPNC